MKISIYETFLKNLFNPTPVSDLRDMMMRCRRVYGKRTAFVLKNDDGKLYNISYEKFYEDYCALSASLYARGHSGKKIAIIGANCYEWAVSYLAAVTIGVAVPLDKELFSDDIMNFIKAAECSAIIGDAKSINKLVDVDRDILIVQMNPQSDELSIASLILEGKKIIGGGTNIAETVKINADEMKILIFTSGTTGKAKGVCLSHKNIVSNILSVAKMVKIKSIEHVLSVLPLHHTYECTLDFLLIIYSGACISYVENLRYLQKNIMEYHPSFIIAVPLLLEKLIIKIEDTIRTNLPAKYKESTKDMPFNETLKSLPWIISMVVKKKVKHSFGGRLYKLFVGAAAIDPEIIECFNLLGIRTMQGYGLTECAPLVAGNNDFYINAASCGLPIPGVEVKISNPNAEGIGEIIARGDNIMLGYFNDPDATAAVIDENGYFHTGDLGYFDTEGWLYIAGRIKNVIVTKNGKNIYPEELEHALAANKIIGESIVIGSMDSGDDVYVKAKILPNLDAIKEMLQRKVLTKEEIAESIKKAVNDLNDKLPSYKRIKSYIIREKEFEKTSTQKIKRFGSNTQDE